MRPAHTFCTTSYRKPSGQHLVKKLQESYARSETGMSPCVRERGWGYVRVQDTGHPMATDPGGEAAGPRATDTRNRLHLRCESRRPHVTTTNATQTAGAAATRRHHQWSTATTATGHRRRRRRRSVSPSPPPPPRSKLACTSLLPASIRCPPHRSIGCIGAHPHPSSSQARIALIAHHQRRR
jgi:hypothetical protein